jgi:hypothetical protein
MSGSPSQRLRGYADIQRRIKRVFKVAQIDRLVYELYGLTEDEITIVEGR